MNRVRFDMRWMREARGQFPPGELSFSMRRTREFEREPLPLLLRLYGEYGPVFSLRLMYAPIVFALGPQANHFMTVSNAANFRWRDGGMGDLIPLLGDGLLTTDGAYHRRARQIMLPAFHREQVAATTDTMTEEVERALAGLAARRPPRSLHLDACAGAAHRDARAVRLRSRPRRARCPHGRGVRARARLLGRGLRRADAARAGQPVAQDAARACAPRPGDLRGDRAPAPLRRARHGHPQPAARRGGRGRLAALRAGAPRPGHDAAVRGPRHHDLDRHLPLLRARPQPAGAGSDPRRAGRGDERRGADLGPARARAAAPRHGGRRDAAHVPAGLDRAAALDRAVRAARRARPGRRARQLLLVGEPPPLRGLPAALAVPARALHSGRARQAAEGRLRPVRRRLAHVHRHALRPARDQGDRDRRAAPLLGRARRADAAAVDSPDAHAVAARRAAGDRARAGATPSP